MKIMLMQQIQLKDFTNGVKTIKKTFDNTVIPRTGDLIEDSVWKDPYEYEVIEVIINYQKDYCYVSLKPVVLETNDKEYLEKYVDMTKLHKWECDF